MQKPIITLAVSVGFDLRRLRLRKCPQNAVIVQRTHHITLAAWFMPRKMLNKRCPYPVSITYYYCSMVYALKNVSHTQVEFSAYTILLLRHDLCPIKFFPNLCNSQCMYHITHKMVSKLGLAAVFLQNKRKNKKKLPTNLYRNLKLS